MRILAGERWLLIVMPDGVLRFDMDRLIRDTPIDTPQGQIHDYRPAWMNPEWRSHKVEQQLRAELVGA